jgi:hypothetical protein
MNKDDARFAALESLRECGERLLPFYISQNTKGLGNRSGAYRAHYFATQARTVFMAYTDGASKKTEDALFDTFDNAALAIEQASTAHDGPVWASLRERYIELYAEYAARRDGDDSPWWLTKEYLGAVEQFCADLHGEAASAHKGALDPDAHN